MKRLALILSIVLPLSLLAQVDLNQKLPTDPDVIYGKLDNGITYYIKKNSKPEQRAFLRLVVNAGSVLEDDDQQGLAHFVEHMCFNGTKHFPKHKLIDYLESIGMKFGADLNAYTSFDETVYMLEIPTDKPENLDTALLILYDWAHNVLLEDEEIDKERGVILEEWRLGKGAMDRMYRKVLPVLYWNSKYAERLPIGKPEIIENFEYDVLRRYYKDWYRPDLEAIIVVGDIDPKQVEQKIKELFSQIPKPENPRPRISPTIPSHKDVKAVVAVDSEANRRLILMVWKLPRMKYKTYADYRQYIIYELVANMLARRYSDLILKPKSPLAFAYPFYNPADIDNIAQFAIYGLAKKEKVNDAIKLMYEYVESAKRYGFAESELERAKKSILAKVEKAYNEKDKTESNVFVAMYQMHYLDSIPYLSPEQDYEIYKQLLPTITLDDVNNAIKQLAPDSNMVVAVMMPPENNIPTEDQIIQIINQVKQAQIQPYKDVKVASTLIDQKLKGSKIKSKYTDQTTGATVITLKNNVTVILKKTDFKNDEILMTATSFGGYSLYSLDDRINAMFAANLVANSGVGKFNKSQLDRFLEGKIVNVSPSISLYTESINGSSSVKDFETMLQLVYLYFTQPRLDQEAYQAYIERMKSMLENKANSPEEVWLDTVRYYLGNRSPYRKPVTAQDLDKINFERAYQIYKERFANPNDFIFIFVGALPDNAEELIAKYLGSLPKTKISESYRDVNASLPVNQTITKFVYKGKEDKSMTYMLFTGLSDKSLETEVHIEAIGQILTKRLLKAIREEQALTYSIMAYPNITYIPQDKYSYIIFYSSKPDTATYIRDEIIKIANEIKQNISDDELNMAKQQLLKQYEVDMKDNQYWLDQLSNYFTIRKVDFVNKYTEAVNNITKESLIEAAKKYLNENSYLAIILVPEK